MRTVRDVPLMRLGPNDHLLLFPADSPRRNQILERLVQQREKHTRERERERDTAVCCLSLLPFRLCLPLSDCKCFISCVESIRGENSFCAVFVPCAGRDVSRPVVTKAHLITVRVSTGEAGRRGCWKESSRH